MSCIFPGLQRLNLQPGVLWSTSDMHCTLREGYDFWRIHLQERATLLATHSMLRRKTLTKCWKRSVLTTCFPSSVQTMEFTDPGEVRIGDGFGFAGLHCNTMVPGVATPGEASVLSHTATMCLESTLHAIVATAPEPHVTIERSCKERARRSTCMLRNSHCSFLCFLCFLHTAVTLGINILYQCMDTGKGEQDAFMYEEPS
jgi:hypothetical protein